MWIVRETKGERGKARVQLLPYISRMTVQFHKLLGAEITQLGKSTLFMHS